MKRRGICDDTVYARRTTPEPASHVRCAGMEDSARVARHLSAFQQALAARTTSTREDVPAYQGANELAARFPYQIETALRPFRGLTLENSDDCAAEVVRRLQTIDRMEFEQAFRDAVQTYESLSPHAIFDRLDVRTRYGWLLAIYQLYVTHIKHADFPGEVYAVKTRTVLRECAALTRFLRYLPDR